MRGRRSTSPTLWRRVSSRGGQPVEQEEEDYQSMIGPNAVIEPLAWALSDNALGGLWVPEPHRRFPPPRAYLRNAIPEEALTLEDRLQAEELEEEYRRRLSAIGVSERQCQTDSSEDCTAWPSWPQGGGPHPGRVGSSC